MPELPHTHRDVSDFDPGHGHNDYVSPEVRAEVARSRAECLACQAEAPVPPPALASLRPPPWGYLGGCLVAHHGHRPVVLGALATGVGPTLGTRDAEGRLVPLHGSGYPIEAALLELPRLLAVLGSPRFLGLLAVTGGGWVARLEVPGGRVHRAKGASPLAALLAAAAELS